MDLFNTERARFAAITLLAVEIAFGTLSFWSHAFDKGQPAHYVVALLLTSPSPSAQSRSWRPASSPARWRPSRQARRSPVASSHSAAESWS